jgi:hypothetical protein
VSATGGPGGGLGVAVSRERPLPLPIPSWRAWVPSWSLIATKHLELRRRRGLMVVVALLTLGLPVLILGIRLLFHAIDPASYGPAGSPSVFAGLVNPMAEFGFIAAAALGATAGTTDLTDGVFRQLVVTGRSRLALYFARVPSGLAILLPLVAVAFAFLCCITAYAGTRQSATVVTDGVPIPVNMTESQLETWLVAHPGLVGLALGPGSGVRAGNVATVVARDIGTIYSEYSTAEQSSYVPSADTMAKVGLWLSLDVGVGFLVGLGLGALTGQRTLSTIVMIALEIIITPILANTTIPYFLNGQRLIVGIAIDQLRPAGLAAGLGAHARGRILFGGRGVLSIPPMPTWAMIAVIAGWIVVWSALGAWRMATRDA